jgi:hypothetical protein
MILEVSGKQDYIFSEKRLKGNGDRSAEIAHVTGGGFLRETAGELYDEGENLIYAGGGHAVLQFPAAEAAKAFARQVSEAVLRRYPGMELFLTELPYDPEKKPGKNLQDLIQALERKKALRRGGFSRRSWGVEALDPVTFRPAAMEEQAREHAPKPVEPPEGWTFPDSFEALTGKDNFIAVVHIDGNAMGARVNRLYASHGDPEDWAGFCRSAKRFSEGIQADFTAAFREMAEEVARQRELWAKLKLKEGLLPLRPVILAGDDVCFVSAGSLGLTCARSFLDKLGWKKNREDGLSYAACAGVAVVHQKYPFHVAYDLAEELCSNAKRFGAELDPAGRVSAMDWHIDFGQLKGKLTAIREDYATEDGRRLELRPVTVTVPEGVDGSAAGGVRTWAFFRALCSAMQGEYGKVARSKIKDLREALKQGDTESRFFLRDKGVTDFLSHCFDAQHGENAAAEAFRQLRESGGLRKEAFRELGGVYRCLLFDAIEMIDHCVFLKEGEK